MTRGTVAISALVALGLGTACVLLLQRQRDLEERIARLEKRPAPAPRAASGAPEAELPPTPAVRPSLPPPAEPARSASVPAPPAEPPVSPAVQDAVAREVERQLKERGGGGFLAGAVRMEDPITRMEKELGLTPAQKVRVADLWKRRDEELLKTAETAPGVEGFREHAKKLQEIEARYDAEIKRELDFTQAQKYDDLRRQGKLMGGVMIQLHLEDKPAEKK